MSPDLKAIFCVLKFTHWYIFLGLLPLSFVCTSLLKPVIIDFCQMTLSTDRAKVRTELGKQAFMFSAPAAWNQLQTDWLLQELILIRAFRNVVKVLKADSKRVRNGCLLFLSVFF